MPSSTIIQAAIFTAGVVLGAGAATLTQTKKTETGRRPAKTGVNPMVDVSPTGAVGLAASNSDVLKYGNPGSFFQNEFQHVGSSLTFLEGPISDLLTRKAYITAYDRRLRHPVWVRAQYSILHEI